MALVRLFWAQLTSMRTALILLLVLALVAIPGSLLPQRPVAPIRVNDWKTANPAVADLYEALGLFDVYGSPWFAAVYLLLTVSLIGCIVPRIQVYAKALRQPPSRTPKVLGRLPASVAGTSADEALAAAEGVLKAKRFRTRRDGDSVAAERGYLREFGNILFHLSFALMLVGVAWNTLWAYKGEVIVVEGQAFSNSLTQYDDFSAGGAFRPANLQPFTIWVDSFTAKFETGEVQRGAARVFEADVRVAHGDGSTETARIEVNHPLVVDGTQVHLIGHGYAPVVTVTDAQGNTAYSGPVVFLPQDGNFTSLGVIKAPDARPNYLGFEGFFLPTEPMCKSHAPWPTRKTAKPFCWRPCMPRRASSWWRPTTWATRASSCPPPSSTRWGRARCSRTPSPPNCSSTCGPARSARRPDAPRACTPSPRTAWSRCGRPTATS